MFYLSALFCEFLVLGIFNNNNFCLMSITEFVIKSTDTFYNAPNIFCNNNSNFLRIIYSEDFNDFYARKPLYIFKNFGDLFFDVSYYLKILSNFGYYTKSLLPFTFFSIFGMYSKKRVRLGLHVKCHKKEKLCRCFFSALLEITNPYSQLQHIFYKVSSFRYNFLNFCFYTFENLLDIIILLDFLLSVICGLFKYLFLLFFPSLTYLFFIITVTFNNSFYNNFGNNFTLLNNYFENFNESQCLTNNVFLFGQKEIISVSTTPSNTVTSYYGLSFYFMVAIFSSIFYQMNNFKIKRQFLPFLIFFFLCFNGNPPGELKKYDLKCFTNSEFFSIEVIKITSDTSSAEMHMNYCHFALNNLSFKRKKSLKFYQLLILLSGNISLNPGSNQDLHDIEDKFEPFWKCGLHFLHINVNSLLSKIDELRDIVGHTKPAILGITESKLDGSVTNHEVKISGYSILRNDRNRNGGGVACYIRSDLCFNSRNIFSNSIEHIFFDLLIPKMKLNSIGIFYRHQMQIIF